MLAHPRAGRDFQVTDDQIAMLAAAPLAGVEVFHPDQPEPQRSGLLALYPRPRSDRHRRQR